MPTLLSYHAACAITIYFHIFVNCNCDWFMWQYNFTERIENFHGMGIKIDLFDMNVSFHTHLEKVCMKRVQIIYTQGKSIYAS